MWMGSNPPRFYWAGPQLPEPIAAVVDDARVSTGCNTAHFSSIPEVCSENICRVHFFLTEADRSCIQNITPTCRFWIYSTIKVKNINNSTQTMKRRKKKDKINTVWGSQQQRQADVTLRLWDAPGGMSSCVEDGTKQHRTLQVAETRLMESRGERPCEPRQWVSTQKKKKKNTTGPSNQLT